MEILDIEKVEVDFIIKELRKGKIFFAPTDTCYGILGNIDKKTVDKIFSIKIRLTDKTLPIFVSKKWIFDLVDSTKNLHKLVDEFWPGALTIVIKSSRRKFRNIMRVDNTIAIREPNFQFLNNLLDKYKEPLTSTSANISGLPSCYSVSGLMHQFRRRKYKPDYILDAGNLPKRKSSSIIDAYTLELLRAGEITHYVIKKRLK